MTAFSGGNRWVGIVALAEPPAPTPIHKMAALRETIERLDTINVSPGLEVSREQFCQVLRWLAEDHAMADNIGRAAYCFALARAVGRQGAAHDAMPNWVLSDVADLLTGRRGVAELPNLVRRSNSKSIATAENATFMRFRSGPLNTKPLALRERLRPAARASRIIDVSGRLGLPDPGEWADAIPLRDALVEFLAGYGWDARESTARMRWLRSACMHASYIFEHNSALSIGINARLLKSFEEVGKRWVALGLLDCYAADRQPKKRGEQSKGLGDLRTTADDEIDGMVLPLTAVLLGKGEAESSKGRFSKAGSSTIRQILGIVALLDGVESIRQLCQVVYLKVKSGDSRRRDWRTILEAQVGNNKIQWDHSDGGPAHQRTFTTYIRDDAGRNAEGAGRAKKEANRKAAENFLRKYYPATVAREEREVTTAPEPLPLVFRNPPARHRQAVKKLKGLFGLPASGEPWLCQALTHTSWAYENKEAITASRQKDNGLLAHHGSFVMDALCAHEHVLRLACANLSPNEDEARMGTPDKYFCEHLFDKLAIDGAVLLGKGQAANPDIAKADAAQAVLAAAWRHRQVQLLDKRPEELHNWLGSFAPIHDGYTKLVHMSAPYGIEIDCISYQDGPDHERRHAVDLVLKSRDDTFTLECDYHPTGKSQAKVRSADAVVDLLRTYQDFYGELDRREVELVSFYIRTQIANSGGVDDRYLQRCALQGHLGATMLIAGDMSAFRRWARITSDIVGPIQPDDESNLQHYYMRCISQARRRSLPVTVNRLASVVTWLEQLRPEVDFVEFPLFIRVNEIAQCVIFSESVDLSTLLTANINDLLVGREQGKNLAMQLTPVQATSVAILLRCMKNWSTSESAVDLDETEGGTLVLIRGLAEGFETRVGPIAEMLAELSPSITCYLDAGSILIKIASEELDDDDIGMSPIERAANAALRAESEVLEVLSTLRRCIPSIYQQVQLFEHAQTASRTASRTDRYRHLSDASEALDAMSSPLNACRRLLVRVSGQ